MEIVDKKGFEEAIASGKTLVDFYADWCGPCKALAPVLEELSKDNPDMKFIKLNIDNEEEIAMKYGIMSIPALFVFKDNEVLGSSIGFKSKAQLQSFIDSLK